MSTAIAVPGNTADTFLVHFFGGGLADERYVVERFKAHADGDIRPWPGEAPAKGRGRRAKRVTAALKAVKAMRPTRTEIIVCTRDLLSNPLAATGPKAALGVTTRFAPIRTRNACRVVDRRQARRG